jgi:hypothetical protein
VLSTQLVYHHFIQRRPQGRLVPLTTIVDRVAVPQAAEV